MYATTITLLSGTRAFVSESSGIGFSYLTLRALGKTVFCGALLEGSGAVTVRPLNGYLHVIDDATLENTKIPMRPFTAPDAPALAVELDLRFRDAIA